MRIKYYWSKFIKKISGAAIKNSILESPVTVNARSEILNTSIGRYSYCGYNCVFIDCEIGRFCSISDYVVAGLVGHPMEWVSTSPAFHIGKGSIPHDFAAKEWSERPCKTIIGNDVWIGRNVLIKRGITIGNGAVVGMGSVVTHDVPPYAVVAGNPAKVIKYRFDAETIKGLDALEWWNLDDDKLRELAPLIDKPKKFLIEGEKQDAYSTLG